MSQTSDLKESSSINLEQFKSIFVDCSYRYQNTKQNSKSLLTENHRDALKELRMNKDIIMIRPDKGSGVVLLDRTAYVDKMDEILCDKSKFQKLDKGKDQTEKVEREKVNSLKSLRAGDIISTGIFENVKPTGSNIPRLYGLPKIHKSGVPLRPILDIFNSPYHKLAKWLSNILEPLHQQVTRYSLKDVFEFVKHIRDVNVSNKQMISFDITSLFTNIPIMETIDFICDSLETHNIHVGLPKMTIKEMLLRCTMNVQFMFNGNFYRQIDGVAMGSPLGPLFAGMFMAKYENSSLGSTIKSFHIHGRYFCSVL